MYNEYLNYIIDSIQRRIRAVTKQKVGSKGGTRNSVINKKNVYFNFIIT